MAATSGAETAAVEITGKFARVEKLLRTEPWTFGFFQAIRLLQRIQRDREPIGKAVQPSKEIVRLEAHTSTSFPASQIQELRWGSPGEMPVMVVNFMGLHGPSAVLPLYYSELIRERLRHKDKTLLAFFNLFNHRMVSLFYQAWEKYRFNVAYERGSNDGSDRFSHYLLDLIGLGTPGLQDRQPVEDDSLLFYSGLLSLQNHSASGLRAILEDYFEVPVQIEQFVGAWRPLALPDQCRFEHGRTVSEQLGLGAVVGDEVWDPQSGARIRLGPMQLARYVEFLPEGSAYEPLKSLTRLYSGNEIDYEIQLVLERNEVPFCELGEVQDRVRPQLGWSTWAKTRPMHRDPADAILAI